MCCLISFRCPHEENLHQWLYKIHTVRILNLHCVHMPEGKFSDVAAKIKVDTIEVPVRNSKQLTFCC